MRTITLIIIHCSAVGPDQTSSAAEIDQWHRQRGWKEIGYHYVIRRDGTIERGRPEAQVGAHCKNHNAHSIGVCYEGGLAFSPKASPRSMVFTLPSSPLVSRGAETSPTGEGVAGTLKYIPADTRTPEQKTSLQRLLTELKARYPKALIVGHHDLDPRKSCPCFDAAHEYITTK